MGDLETLMERVGEAEAVLVFDRGAERVTVPLISAVIEGRGDPLTVVDVERVLLTEPDLEAVADAVDVRDTAAETEMERDTTADRDRPLVAVPENVRALVMNAELDRVLLRVE